MIIPYYWFIVLGLLLLFFLVLVFRYRKPRHVANLHNKAVLITGCDSGFGFDLARRLDQLGVTVFAGCLFPNGSGAKMLKNLCSDKLNLLQLDVTSDDQIQEAVATVKNNLRDKELWGVVNNAGIATVGYIEWMTVELVKKLFDVNTLGPFRVTKAFLPLLRQSQGRVVIVASLGGVYPLQGCGVYSMSKHATVSLAHSLRRELAQFNISVHLVNPASYQTPLLNIPITEEMKLHWKKLPEEVRLAYDEKYIESYEDEVVNAWKQFAKPESKIYEVTDDLLDATLSRSPKSIYVPGLLGKIQFFLLSISSIKTVDYFSESNLKFQRMISKTKLCRRKRGTDV